MRLFHPLVSSVSFRGSSFVSECVNGHYAQLTSKTVTSSLELASKNIVCGSVKMVYALIYTLFLGFGLQIGSDLFLLFDPTARHHLATLAAKLSTTVTLIGTFASDNSTDSTSPAVGTFSFTNATNNYMADIVDGCYRPSSFGWFIQPFPWWTQFIIVPIFSVLSSLANLQPWKTKELLVMVVISCASYATNKIANHYIFDRSDIVSAIGAFTVGLLGNIYSRKMGGTAFTSMVTGVLFLVPVSVPSPKFVFGLSLDTSFSIFSPASPKREVSQRMGRRSTLGLR